MTGGPSVDVEVIAEPDTARVALDPVRARVLDALATPGSATSVAAELGLSRQKVNYHLRLLERHGLVELVEERPRRGLTERILVASAASYAMGPAVLGQGVADPRTLDQLSSSYLIALGARLVGEVGELARRARSVGKPLPTLAIDTEINFASPAQRAAFAEELGEVVARLAATYHDEQAVDGRPYRLVIGSHPLGRNDQEREQGKEAST